MLGEPTRSLKGQISALRRSVTLAVRDDLVVLDAPADAALAAVDPHVATDLDLREAQLRQALALRDDGRPALDLLLGFFRGRMLIFAAGQSVEGTREQLALPGATDLLADHVLFSIDGPFAWELLGRWDTPTAIGLPYLGVYTPQDGVHVVRAGDTGEYGYRILVRRDLAEQVWHALNTAAEGLEPARIGAEARRHASLENWVFDIQREGASDLDALELQLTWRLDLNKQATGLDAIRAHRETGLRRRLTAMTTASTVADGTAVAHEGTAIGRVLTSAPRLDFGSGHSVLAVLDMPYAHPGMSYAIAGQTAQTVSAPFLLNRSLFLNPQRHAWANRDEVELPAEILWPNTTSW